MEDPQPETCCSMCNKPVTPQENTCTDENGKAVHTDCYAKGILQDNRTPSSTAA